MLYNHHSVDSNPQYEIIFQKPLAHIFLFSKEIPTTVAELEKRNPARPCPQFFNKNFKVERPGLGHDDSVVGRGPPGRRRRLLRAGGRPSRRARTAVQKLISRKMASFARRTRRTASPRGPRQCVAGSRCCATPRFEESDLLAGGIRRDAGRVEACEYARHAGPPPDARGLFATFYYPRPSAGRSSLSLRLPAARTLGFAFSARARAHCPPPRALFLDLSLFARRAFCDRPARAHCADRPPMHFSARSPVPAGTRGFRGVGTALRQIYDF